MDMGLRRRDGAGPNRPYGTNSYGTTNFKEKDVSCMYGSKLNEDDEDE